MRLSSDRVMTVEQYTAGMVGLLGGVVLSAAFFWGAGWLDADTTVIEPEVARIVDATTVEMRGYGPDGELGVFVYDCEQTGGRLVCTQREGDVGRLEP